MSWTMTASWSLWGRSPGQGCLNSDNPPNTRWAQVPSLEMCPSASTNCFCELNSLGICPICGWGPSYCLLKCTKKKRLELREGVFCYFGITFSKLTINFLDSPKEIHKKKKEIEEEISIIIWSIWIKLLKHYILGFGISPTSIISSFYHHKKEEKTHW